MSGYTKIIQSGTLIERYDYEKSPIPTKRGIRLRNKHAYGRRSRDIYRARGTFYRLVRANTRREAPPLFLTLTMREQVPLTVAWKQYTSFVSAWYKAGYKGLRYVVVPEFQRRGAVHFHALIWGYPVEYACIQSKEWYTDETGKRHRKHGCQESDICERNTRFLSRLWGAGFLDIFQTDGAPRLAGYLAKYMLKTMQDKRLAGRKAYSASRRLMRPVSVSDPWSVDIFKAQLGLTGDNPLQPLRQTEYSTVWLGRAVKRIYNLTSEYEE